MPFRETLPAVLESLVIDVMPATPLFRFAGFVAPLADLLLGDAQFRKDLRTVHGATVVLLQTCLFAAWLFLPTVAFNVHPGFGSTWSVFLARALAPLFCVPLANGSGGKFLKLATALLCWVLLFAVLMPGADLRLNARYSMQPALGAIALLVLSVIAFVAFTSLEKRTGSSRMEVALLLSLCIAPMCNFANLLLPNVWVPCFFVALFSWIHSRATDNYKNAVDMDPYAIAFLFLEKQTLIMLVNSATFWNAPAMAVFALIVFVICYRTTTSAAGAEKKNKKES